MAIVDRQVKKLRSKNISSVKVVWRNHSKEEATWEAKDVIRDKYPQLFPTLDIKFSLIRGPNFFKGEGCNTLV